jgi:hypothetical protein
MSGDPDRPAPLDLGAGRLEAFSDAVMAVIITILALELRAPLGPTVKDLYDQLPSLFIYVLSFVFIAIYWNNHHHLLRATTRISGAVMWANMLLLFCLSLIPVVTEWLHDFYRSRLPAASFGIVALASARTDATRWWGWRSPRTSRGPSPWSSTRPAWAWRASACGPPTPSMRRSP